MLPEFADNLARVLLFISGVLIFIGFMRGFFEKCDEIIALLKQIAGQEEQE